VNFGWGGTYNGWYLLPDEMPYGLTVIEGVVVDIMKDNSSEIADSEILNSISVFPNPANEDITIYYCKENTEIYIFDLTGRIMLSQKVGDKECKVNTSALPVGIYIITMSGENDQMFNAKLQIVR
jgi:hypothetical protein